MKIQTILITTLIATLALTSLTSCQESFDKRLHREAIEYTENKCPQEVESGLMLDSVSYNITSRTYTSFFSANAANEQVLRSNSPLLHQMLVTQLINNTDYKDVKDKGVTFRYVYYSQATKTVFYETTVTANEYGISTGEKK